MCLNKGMGQELACWHSRQSCVSRQRHDLTKDKHTPGFQSKDSIAQLAQMQCTEPPAERLERPAEVIVSCAYCAKVAGMIILLCA